MLMSQPGCENVIIYRECTIGGDLAFLNACNVYSISVHVHSNFSTFVTSGIPTHHVYSVSFAKIPSVF